VAECVPAFDRDAGLPSERLYSVLHDAAQPVGLLAGFDVRGKHIIIRLVVRRGVKTACPRNGPVNGFQTCLYVNAA